MRKVHVPVIVDLADAWLVFAVTTVTSRRPTVVQYTSDGSHGL